MANATLSLALDTFTSEFEMESGGAYPLLPPGEFFCIILVTKPLGHYMVKTLGSLVLVSSTCYHAYTPNLSTS